MLTRYEPQRLLLQQRAVGGRRSAGSRVYAAQRARAASARAPRRPGHRLCSARAQDGPSALWRVRALWRGAVPGTPSGFREACSGSSALSGFAFRPDGRLARPSSFRLVSGSRIGRRKAVLGRTATESIGTIPFAQLAAGAHVRFVRERVLRVRR